MGGVGRRDRAARQSDPVQAGSRPSTNTLPAHRRYRSSAQVRLTSGSHARGGMIEMPEMPAMARTVVISPPYRMFARRVLLPWVVGDEQPAGEGLEIGAGSGVMSAQLLAAFPTLRMIVTDY